jgi:hypothetical protein
VETMTAFSEVLRERVDDAQEALARRDARPTRGPGFRAPGPVAGSSRLSGDPWRRYEWLARMCRNRTCQPSSASEWSTFRLG